MARHPLVKKKSRLFVLAPGPKIGGAARTLQSTRRRCHRRDEARRAPYPRRGRTPGPPRTRDVSASVPRCCCARSPRNAIDRPRRHAWPERQVGPCCCLVLGGAVTLPATSDNHHHLVAVVGPAGQLFRQDASVDEGAGARTAGGLQEAGPVRGREGDRGAGRYLRTQDLRRRVTEVEACHLRAAPLPYAEVRLGSPFDRSDGYDPCALGDEDRYS